VKCVPPRIFGEQNRDPIHELSHSAITRIYHNQTKPIGQSGRADTEIMSDLNHMPHTSPCISGENWSHNFNKPVHQMDTVSPSDTEQPE